jgi:hypothetical protein
LVSDLSLPIIALSERKALQKGIEEGEGMTERNVLGLSGGRDIIISQQVLLSAFANVERALLALEQTALQERYQRGVARASKLAFDPSEQQLR